MKIRKLSEAVEFTAGDQTLLRELWNPLTHTGFTGRYSLAHACLPAGKSSTPHLLKSHELYYILSGSGVIHVGEESASVVTGDAIEIPPKARQWIENTGPAELKFLCVVDPGWRPEDEKLL
ncbi:MAG: cupin domain-containing protein [Candidatus Zixiibacteriota bacterium]